MADTEAAVAAPPPPQAATANSSNGNVDPNKKIQVRERKPREEKPIEELFDLSQPIPKVDKPNKDEFDKALEETQAELDRLKNERAKVQTEIDNSMNDPASKAALQDLRTQLTALKTQKSKLLDEKKALRDQLDQAKGEADKIIKDKKESGRQIKYSSIEEINAAIAKLQRQQETTTMSLNEEKRLIKEMDALNASKKLVADLKDKDQAMDGVRETRKSIAEQIKTKDKEVDVLNPQMDAVMKKMKEINERNDQKRDAIQGLFAQREALKKDTGAKLKEKDAVRDDFRARNDAWYNYQRALKAQKKMAYEEEKKRREEEKAAYLAELEAEEAKKVPYEAEQALCDYLADYLERTYLSGKSENGATVDEKKAADVVQVKEDPFAGLMPVNKKSDDDYFGKNKGKKKRVRVPKKEGAAAGPGGGGPFTLSVDTFEQFGLIGLTPPTKVDQVANSVEELRAKKDWYKQQPRGSVPTANDIRKANEKAAAKLRQQVETTTPIANGSDDAKNAGVKKSGGGGFNLSSDEFVPLSASSTTSTGGANASWGKSAAAAPAAAAAAAADETAE